MLKTIGYSISSLSVLCLGAVSWDGVRDKPLLVAVLIAGMATSVMGMAFRWTSFIREQHAKGEGAGNVEGKRPRRAAAGHSRSGKA